MHRQAKKKRSGAWRTFARSTPGGWGDEGALKQMPSSVSSAEAEDTVTLFEGNVERDAYARRYKYSHHFVEDRLA